MCKRRFAFVLLFIDGTLINCTISNVQLEGSDTIRVGGWLVLFGFILLNKIPCSTYILRGNKHYSRIIYS